MLGCGNVARDIIFMEKFMYKKEPVCYVRNSSLISSEVDDDLVMIDIDKGSYLELLRSSETI